MSIVLTLQWNIRAMQLIFLKTFSRIHNNQYFIFTTFPLSNKQRQAIK